MPSAYYLDIIYMILDIYHLWMTLNLKETLMFKNCGKTSLITHLLSMETV